MSICIFICWSFQVSKCAACPAHGTWSRGARFMAMSRRIVVFPEPAGPTKMVEASSKSFAFSKRPGKYPQNKQKDWMPNTSNQWRMMKQQAECTDCQRHSKGLISWCGQVWSSRFTDWSKWRPMWIVILQSRLDDIIKLARCGDPGICTDAAFFQQNLTRTIFKDVPHPNHHCEHLWPWPFS